MNKPHVSVIVPVYNVSKYLTKCLDSLVNQTLEEVELILVNDASPDLKDDAICKSYAKKDDRIRYIIHERNTGQGGARNTGIKSASAELIGFVDSDDWVEPDMYERLLSAILNEDADASQCYFTEHKGEKSQIRKLKKFRKQKDFLNATNVLVWNKLFRKSLFVDNDIFFPVGHSHEDTATLPRLAYFINTMAQVKEPLYHYISARDGATTANYERIFADHSFVYGMIKDFMLSKELWKTHRKYFDKRLIRSLLHDVNRLQNDKILSSIDKEELVREALDRSIQFLEYPERIRRYSLNKTKSSLEWYQFQLNVFA